MPESLRAARERLAARMAEALYETEEECAAVLRELQRQAMEAVLLDMEYEQRPDGGWRGVAWNELKPHYVDALLDGPAPGEVDRDV